MPDHDGMPILEDIGPDYDYDTYIKELCIHVARRDIPELVQKIKDNPEIPERKITDKDIEGSSMSGGELQYHTHQSFLHSNLERNRNIKTLKTYRDILEAANVKE